MHLKLSDVGNSTFVGYGRSKKVSIVLPDGTEFVTPLGEGALFKSNPINMKCCGVYVISAHNGNLLYVGSTRCLYTRLRAHRTTLRNNTHNNRNLQKAFAETDGQNTFDVKYFEVANRELAFTIEQTLMDELAPSGKLANISPDSRSFRGTKLSDESKEKMRRIALARPEMGVEVRNKISLANKGKKRSEEESKRLACMSRGLRDNPEFVKKWKEKRCRKVLIDGVVFESLSAAGRAHNCSPGRVLDRIKRNSEKYKGWSYLE